MTKKTIKKCHYRDFDHFVMSVAKEGKVFDQKKPLQPFLYTHEGTEMGCIIFFTSSTMTVYSSVHPKPANLYALKIIIVFGAHKCYAISQK